MGITRVKCNCDGVTSHLGSKGIAVFLHFLCLSELLFILLGKFIIAWAGFTRVQTPVLMKLVYIKKFLNKVMFYQTEMHISVVFTVHLISSM